MNQPIKKNKSKNNQDSIWKHQKERARVNLKRDKK